MKKPEESSSSHTITLTQGQVSRIVACLLLGAFFIFVAGYYWGKKVVVEQLAGQLEQDALSDKIYASLYSLYETGDEQRDETEKEENTQENQENNEESSTQEKNSRFYAKLIGFGSKKYAQQYVQKLAQRGIDVTIVERQSKSAQGKAHTWYQVVTRPLPKNDLMRIIDQLKITDRLADVSIIEFSNELNERSRS